jgi:regulator of sirC expression with transglutaminase-like and TPR domain
VQIDKLPFSLASLAFAGVLWGCFIHSHAGAMGDPPDPTDSLAGDVPANSEQQPEVPKNADRDGDSSRSHAALIAEVRPSVVIIRVDGRDGEEFGVGTGFVIDEQGLIATNFHVINEGREFTVETSGGVELPVLAIEASDVNRDLAIIRVDVSDQTLQALELATNQSAEQGMRVLAFGNPLGLENSVVEGIVSAEREVEGRSLLQLAMPIEPGNSGGPLVDLDGTVHGIINMKSAIDDNLGFAIPIDQLNALSDTPNPVAIDRWVRLGKVNEDRWTVLFGADWKQQSGRVSVSGRGDGFGGRSLLLSEQEVPERPFEVAAMVRLDNESGAAGLAFSSDGDNRHYGFYPSGGRLRLTCFRGPSVFSWQVLDEVDSEDYLPGEWNHLKVRVESDRILCYVNGSKVIESTDRQLTTGKVGLVKFRETEPEFSHFRIGKQLATPELSESAQTLLNKLTVPQASTDFIGSEQIEALGASAELSSRELIRRAVRLESMAKQMRQLAGDVRREETLSQLRRLDEIPESQRLLRGALLIAKIDNPEIDVSAYMTRVEEMAEEIRAAFDDEASPDQIRQALHRYLFQENGFHGSRSEYYHPANSHLDRVIDDREGLPITLAILYMELGRRLGIDVEGVGLPGHFLVRHVISSERQQLVDVFERGEHLSRKEAAEIVLLHAGRPLRESDLAAQETRQILSRVLNNLVGIAGRNEDAEAMLRYSEAIVAINPDEPDYRLMRAQLRGFTGRNQAAVEDVDWLLESGPGSLNRTALERLRRSLLDEGS